MTQENYLQFKRNIRPFLNVGRVCRLANINSSTHRRVSAPFRDRARKEDEAQIVGSGCYVSVSDSGGCCGAGVVRKSYPAAAAFYCKMQHVTCCHSVC